MSLIDPSKLPGKGLDAEAVATHAATISTLATSISDGGAATLRAWQALPASYESDGADHLYDVMTPVGTASTTVGDGLTSVSNALKAYADTVRPIEADLKALTTEATAFVAKVKNFTPHDVTTTDFWVKASGGVMGFIDPPKTHIDSWDQDQGLVDKNNALIRRGAELTERWLEAQRTCANAILAASGQGVCAAPGQASPDQIMAQAEAMLPWSGDKDIQTPWGSTSSRKESCGEKTMGFPAHFVGGVFTGALGMVKGVSSLVTGWDGNGIPWEAELAAGWITGRGDLASDAWSRAGKGYAGAWLGMAHLGVSLVPGADSTLLALGQSPWATSSGRTPRRTSPTGRTTTRRHFSTRSAASSA
ncbi:hypothetical protein GCM10025867_25630 [Frondihabitans sucicola]|uniref:WXG100 family type VII secretion target n=1 Tax=Frondihabitans sucicola TaxID=1268041 RepID=A0ABM8GPY9_9MICO|nr:hypothetical protein [Frondihabitans sucicola]BDZ50322.1 hypothetical protein GCM10025867_25630 [Frondihabitans sucicola]